MSTTPNLSIAEDNHNPAQELACIKSLLALMLQAIGQADGGRVIIKMEKQIAQMEDKAQAAIFCNTINQIKEAYRQ